MSEDCLFCKIIGGDIPGDIVYQDDNVIAFRDINPQAPVHILIVPRKHIATLNELAEDDQALCGYLTLTARRLAAEQNIEEDGYRLIMNCNEQGGQTVFHIHMHLLGGRQLTHLG
ncbi:MAG: histidine triad nucleotide-binding protein [Gammaproteobacteria bacterium]|nr:histidine triad nucleotide-binding protein [Gammaproteobacteria bacterium]